ncbi:hypothetical protein [Nodularia chucula]
MRLRRQGHLLDIDIFLLFWLRHDHHFTDAIYLMLIFPLTTPGYAATVI